MKIENVENINYLIKKPKKTEKEEFCLFLFWLNLSKNI
jgi:hypothetical protein